MLRAGGSAAVQRAAETNRFPPRGVPLALFFGTRIIVLQLRRHAAQRTLDAVNAELRDAEQGLAYAQKHPKRVNRRALQREMDRP